MNKEGMRPIFGRVPRGAACLLLALGVVAGSTVPAWASPVPPAKRSFVVVAVVDSGINPYHLDFRRPDLTAHPSTFVEGYPGSAERFDLTFGESDLRRARAADADEWTSVSPGELHWIPGTNIIGAVDVTGEREAFFDTIGHGTGVASLAGGAIHGPPTDDVLLVILNGFDEGLAWAAAQPWIDIVTNSWSVFTPVVDQTAEASRAAVKQGKVVCFASGNLSAPLWFLEGQGPSWHVRVPPGTSTSEPRRIRPAANTTTPDIRTT